MAPAISLAMIVRDEAVLLPQCLASFKSLADEVVIVDTGSTDATVDIATRAGATVLRVEWTDDFSEARNTSLQACTGEWVFVADADERLRPEGAAAIQALTYGGRHRCHRFLTRNYTNDAAVSDFLQSEPSAPEAQGFLGWYPSTKVRLFPNLKSIRFEGLVHEMVNQSAEKAGLVIENCPEPILHYPLLQPKARIDKKRSLYLALGQLKTQAWPRDAQAHAELGTQYAEMGEYQEAVQSFSKALAINPDNPDILKNLGGVLHFLGRNDQAEQSLRLALKIDKNLPDVWRNLGVVRAARDDWTEALACFTEALSLRPDSSEGLRHLSVAQSALKQTPQAIESAHRALELQPCSPECHDRYVSLMIEEHKAQEALQTIENLRPKLPQDASVLYSLARLYLALGSPEEARKVLRQCLDADPVHEGAKDLTNQIGP